MAIPDSLFRHEVIMAGVGGKGVLVAGLLLAQAAMAKYRNVVWFPSYASSMRGAPCECTVIFSAEKIASPVPAQAEAIIVFSPSQLKPFERRVRPGGIILVENAGFSGETEKQDVRILLVPAVAVSMELGDSRAANLVLLGAYIRVTEVLPPELVEAELNRRFSGEEALLNQRAFREGMKLVEGENI